MSKWNEAIENLKTINHPHAKLNLGIMYMADGEYQRGLPLISEIADQGVANALEVLRNYYAGVEKNSYIAGMYGMRAEKADRLGKYFGGITPTFPTSVSLRDEILSYVIETFGP